MFNHVGWFLTGFCLRFGVGQTKRFYSSVLLKYKMHVILFFLSLRSVSWLEVGIVSWGNATKLTADCRIDVV